MLIKEAHKGAVLKYKSDRFALSGKCGNKKIPPNQGGKYVLRGKSELTSWDDFRTLDLSVYYPNIEYCLKETEELLQG